LPAVVCDAPKERSTVTASGRREAKQIVASLFGRVAASYDQAGFLHESARHLVARVPLRPGAVVLDVATATGVALLAVVSAYGPCGLLVGVDLAEPMVARARRRLRAAGLAGMDVLVMDAEQLAFRAESFDAVLCASALYTMPDPRAALGGFHRVLRPGGTVAVSIFGDLDERWCWKRTLLSRLGPRLEPTAPSLDAAALERLLRDAGFADGTVQIDSERLDVVYRDVDDWLAAEWTHGERRPLELMDRWALEAYRDEAAVAIETSRERDGALHWRPEVVLATASKR
jgi:ubiquinone/menaquinone biosynthesis C-methylase UbiE